MSTQTTESLSPEGLDNYHRALSHQWRRIVVAVLDRRRAAHVTELAEEIAIRTDDCPAGRVEIALQHCHLPLLARIGVLELDGETVRPRQPAFATLSELNRDTLP